MTEQAERVTDEMLAALAARFRGEQVPDLEPDPGPAFYPTASNLWNDPASHGLDPGDEVYTATLPGFTGSGMVLGTDGSAPSSGGYIASWAAVAGNGYASFGWFVETGGSSCNAEMEAIRYGLRAYPDGAPVSIRLDNIATLDGIHYMLDHPGHTWQRLNGRRFTWGVTNEAALREVSQHLWRLNVRARYIGDPEGTTDSKRCPADPTMRAAHRLCWAARRLVTFGLPLDDPVVFDWLTQEFAVGVGRNAANMRQTFEKFATSY